MYLELKENRPHGTKDFPFTLYHICKPTQAFQIPIHWHEEMEIIYVRKAPLTIMIDGQEYTAEDHSIFLVNPGQLHLMGSEVVPVDYFTLLFPLEFISFQTEDAFERELMAPLRRQSMVFNAKIPQGRLRDSLCELLEQLITKHESNECSDQIGTRILLLQFVQLLVENGLVKHTDMGNAQNMQKELLSYLQQNYSRRLSLEELSVGFHLSEKYISRYFREHFHLSLTQYVNYLRLTHARHLLETTALAVTEVAMQCGFPNVSYFIRTFKKSFGMSPLQYRRNLYIE